MVHNNEASGASREVHVGTPTVALNSIDRMESTYDPNSKSQSALFMVSNALGVFSLDVMHLTSHVQMDSKGRIFHMPVSTSVAQRITDAKYGEEAWISIQHERKRRIS